MKQKKINIRQKFDRFSDYWSPKVIAEMNDYQFKLARLKGDFVWHNHMETDEVFIIKGKMKIEFRDKTVFLEEDEMYVVPKVVDHKPFADEECKIMLVEPKGVVNTGSTTCDLTSENDVWL